MQSGRYDDGSPRLPGSEEEAAGLLDDYLAAQRERAEARARGAGEAGVTAVAVSDATS
jgi:hypothetical protein